MAAAKEKVIGGIGGVEDEDQDMGEFLDKQELNRVKYSKNIKQRRKARGKGGRGYSPDWMLEDRILKAGDRKSEVKFIDYRVDKYVHVKRGVIR